MIFRLIVLLSIVFVSCKQIPQERNKETLKKPESSWEILSKDDSFKGWHIYQNESGKKSGWIVENGVYTFNHKYAKGEGNRSLTTDETYTSFEIKFEWKISKNSNSGFIWGVSEDEKYEHPHETGPEIQVIDADIHGEDPNNQKYTVGALYALSPPISIASKKPGKWNQYHITINYETNQGKVILNGTEINNFPLSGDKWDAMVKNSKFTEMIGFGKYKKGHISFQDHAPGTVSYKNIKIRRL